MSDELEDELRPRLTDDFLATLADAVRTCGWTVDHVESAQFVRWCYRVADKPSPDLDPFEEEE